MSVNAHYRRQIRALAAPFGVSAAKVDPGQGVAPADTHGVTERDEIMIDMLTLKVNDAAAQVLGMIGALRYTAAPGDLTTGLQERIDCGLRRRGSVLTWADSVGVAEGAPSIFNDLTAWECADTSFHIEDFVQVDVAIVDDAPVISDGDQRTLLLHGFAFALQFSRLVYALSAPSPVRCIVAANDTNATFRFHQIRQGESWNRPDLDAYREDKMIVLDIEPATA
ncbi:hypothetical protein [Jidongwangia harbinensis]|uniref:hypothetical protein n=1 Tax=Jidongwangia harbinensis TaxID=2878561 RepID=UPI001CD9D865|nr:hypothetical protein [Jidongwangia harbinensis]MCA2216315.1 hypothetical protein [Jidongwangia harbinensis]MCA2217050.1 hypothetical protein [Jidongwangia harbinensis]